MLSRVAGGRALLIASGAVLVIVGIRVARPVAEADRDRGTVRRRNRPLLVAASAGVGLFTGLLANGGGFLLVPLYLLFFGLSVRDAVGTSLVVIAVLALPTLATHWALGHVDWGVAGALGCGLLPASAVGSVLGPRLEAGESCESPWAGSLAFSGSYSPPARCSPARDDPRFPRGELCRLFSRPRRAGPGLGHAPGALRALPGRRRGRGHGRPRPLRRSLRRRPAAGVLQGGRHPVAWAPEIFLPCTRPARSATAGWRAPTTSSASSSEYWRTASQNAENFAARGLLLCPGSGP